MTITLDARSKKLCSFRVPTYLDSQRDVVSLEAVLVTLLSAVNCMEQPVLNATAKEIQIRTTKLDILKMEGH